MMYFNSKETTFQHENTSTLVVNVETEVKSWEVVYFLAWRNSPPPVSDVSAFCPTYCLWRTTLALWLPAAVVGG